MISHVSAKTLRKESAAKQDGRICPLKRRSKRVAVRMGMSKASASASASTSS